MGRLGAVLADSGPVVILAAIAAAGSFTHIRDTARQHGQHGAMAWAIAVCIDLTCVMAARERQRDKRTGRPVRGLSWPSLVLAGGVLLSLAANLAQAEPTAWGWITAATPAGAFLVAVSMLERRSSARRSPEAASAPSSAVPPSFGRPSPALVPVPDEQDDRQDERPPAQDEPAPSAPPTPSAPSGGPAAELLTYARRVADEHQQRHGRPITRDALRARLGISKQLASDLLRHIRTA